MIGELTPRFRVIFGERRRVADFISEPDEKFFNRLIRKRASSAGSVPVQNAMDTERKISESLVQIRGVYGLYKTSGDMRTWFPGSDFAALGLVTIGGALEEAVAQRSRDNDQTGAFLLDAWGSAWVEGAVSVMDRVIRSEARLTGLSGGKRRSPGYPPWKLEAQAQVLEILGGGDIGVAITTVSLMIPRKSISFGLALAES
ncbi:MAG TPA: hypothetical protein PLV45_01025 [bacterium]|nr:hypothetical protein [bacterium]